MTTAGKMRDFVSLMRLTTSDDPRWGPAGTWLQYGQGWAEVLPLTGTQAGNEQFTQQGVQSLVNYAVTIRYRYDVSPKDRIIYRGQPLEIISSADSDGKRRTLSINARQYAGVTQ
jgi:SPP1 family predicted phage head-tail adaptor